MNSTVNKAIDSYLAAVGPQALQPSIKLSYVTKNGIVILRNVEGLLAIVTTKGTIMDRIGGTRIEAGEVPA